MIHNSAVKITSSNISWFQSLLQSRCAGNDVFLSSSGYFLLTGRKGLWVVTHEGYWAIVCMHPNVNDSLLVFPGPGTPDVSFIESVCSELRQLSNFPIRLCRIHETYLDQFKDNPRFNLVEELVLDWRYPCAVLSASTILAESGRRFSKYRQKIRKIDKLKIKIEYPVQQQFSSHCEALFRGWAETVQKDKNTDIENLLDPNRAALQLAIDASINVQACLIYYYGNPIGFFAFEVLAGCDEVCCISRCCSREIRGASEYAYHVQSLIIKQEGYDKFNQNGAETKSLHDFRKKLSPSRTYVIKSFEYLSE